MSTNGIAKYINMSKAPGNTG